MAAALSSTFRINDEMSQKLETIADAGEKMIESWKNAEEATSVAIENITRGAEDISRATENAAAGMDGWTQAADRYDKAALEATHSLEELVEMGMKSQKSLEEQQDAANTAAENYSYVKQALEEAAEAQNGLTAAQKEADKLSEKMEESTKNTAELQSRIAAAQNEATAAQAELTAAQEAANKAIEEYNALVESGKGSTSDYAAAADKAVQAEDTLKQAADKAAEAQNNLEKETKECDDAFQKLNADPFKDAMQALQSLGIVKTIKDITDGVLELASAFSDAESIVVKATGSSGAALDDFSNNMMNVYAKSKTGSLNDAAGAIGEINTRMHLTGDEIENMAGKFLDFAEVTGGNVVNSVKQVTQIMNKWNIESEDTELLLDKLTYEAQVSGASVAGMSSQLINGAATYQNMGLSIDNVISMLGDFELAGVNSSSAMFGLRQAVTKAAAAGEDANRYLIRNVRQISELEDATQATALATEIFGTRAGQELALAIRSGTLTVDTFTKSLDSAAGTLEATAEAAQTLDQKWEQATNNIGAAFSKAFSPAIEKISGAIAGAANSIGDFLNENTLLTQILGSLGAGIGATVAVFLTLGTTIKFVIPAVVSLGRSIYAATGPWGLLAAAIVGVVAAIGTFVAAAASTKTDLSDLYSSIDSTHEAFVNVTAGIDEATDGIARESEKATRLTEELYSLANGSEKSAGSQQRMKAIVGELNDMFPELGLNVENVTDDLDGLINKIDEYNSATAKKKEYEVAVENYTKLTGEVDRDSLVKAISDTDVALRTTTDNLTSNPLAFAWGYLTNSGVVAEQKAAEERAAKAQRDLEEYDRMLKECTDTIEAYGERTSGASGEQIAFGEASVIAVDAVRDKTAELITSYSQAYDAAYKSISGQMGLFEQMAISCEVTTEQMIDALKSQYEYMETYTENLKAAQQYGLDQGLINSLSDGSKESAGYLNAIVDKIEELGTGSDEAKQFIDEMNNSFQNVGEAKDKFSKTVADMETGFSEQLEEICADMEKAIDRLNMSDEAEMAAKATISAYIEALKNGAAGAADASALIENAIAGAISNTSTPEKMAYYNSKNEFYASMQAGTVSGYASGTTNADDVAIVGENGPELVTGIGGASVFPTTETDRIISAVDKIRSFHREAPTIKEFNSARSGGSNPEEYKRISLEINGGGTISLGKGTNKQEVLDVITENLRPILLEILEEEAYEEGEGVYDF